jgi:hypothetical protein
MSVSRLRAFGAVTGAAVLTVGVTVGITAVRAQAGGARVAADGDDATSLVETFDYPGADAIQAADPRVVLLRGDGHIVYDASCAAPASGVGQIVVRPQPDPTAICFDVLGGSGWLSMRIEGVFEIDGRKATTGDAQTATATVQPQDEAQKDVTLKKTAVTPIGVEGDNTVPTVLLDLTVAAAPAAG